MQVIQSIRALMRSITNALSPEQSLRDYILSNDPKNASDVERLMIEWQKTQATEFPL